MDTPIFDFLQAYRQADFARLHMPGHKGVGPLGCEGLDITEVKGADSLYEAGGIIRQSERNATALFGTGRTLYSTEGSSQCIRAMLYIALSLRRPGTAPLFLAARNVHKAFVYGAALNDAQVIWLQGQNRDSLCRCVITPEQLDNALNKLPQPPAGVYLTSPDYLGTVADIKAMAEVCHRHGTLLLVDNAHGAYLHFLEPTQHPMDLGADLCCDSAHKTLPVLTGGAYLHISKRLPDLGELPRHAMGLFGSTSPSYLIMASLDHCNNYLDGQMGVELAETVKRLDALRGALRSNGWELADSDPLRVTLKAPDGMTGQTLAELLRQNRIECEYADDEYLVLMFTPQNRAEDIHAVAQALGKNRLPYTQRTYLPSAVGKAVLSIRQAVFAPQVSVPVEKSVGKICASPVVSCPPAIPIVISGEVITEQAVEIMEHYHIDAVNIVK